MEDSLLVREEQLLLPFTSSEQPASNFRIGAEMEKFGVRADGTPISYEGADGVRALLEAFAREGWEADYEYAGGPLLALLKDGASITLEPGSQFELSGAPFPSTHQVAAELADHLARLVPKSSPHGVRWLGLGFHPFATRAQYTFVPKQRYGIMREYLPTRGGKALDMMLRTSTVQANFDYDSEADAMKKMRVALRLAPLTTALFANSPFFEGKAFGGKSYRAQVWLDVDPDRSGLVPALLKSNAGYIDYARWALDAPMFLVKRPSGILRNTGQTFRDYWKNGFEGERATVKDFQLHLNTLFPEVRLKKTIEVRGADAQGSALAPALSALWAGILYDATSLQQLDELTADYTESELNALRPQLPQLALQASFRGAPLLKLAERVLEIAAAGLQRRNLRDAAGNDERIWLRPLTELVTAGQCPADAVLARASAHGGNFVAAVTDAADLTKY